MLGCHIEYNYRMILRYNIRLMLTMLFINIQIYKSFGLIKHLMSHKYADKSFKQPFQKRSIRSNGCHGIYMSNRKRVSDIVISSLQNELRRSSLDESSELTTDGTDVNDNVKKIKSNYDQTINNRVRIRSTQKQHNIDLQKLKEQVHAIQTFLAVENFDVDITICSDVKIRSLNSKWRNIRKSTDILSFPICEFTSPGIFVEDSTFSHHLHLGDIFVSPSYVQRRINEEKIDRENGIVYEDDEFDAGVSKAMSNVFTLEERLPLLLIHGILHLLGYDHEIDEDWKLMTDKESEVIEELKSRNII